MSEKPKALPESATLSMMQRERFHPHNTLNDLSGREWIKFTKSWFICDSRRYFQNKDTALHPARFPEELATEFIRFFTKRGEWVLDPFCGSGATLVACLETGRHGVGLELSETFVRITEQRLHAFRGETRAFVIHGDAREATTQLAEYGPGVFDYILTSPPYFNMLRKSRGHIVSALQKRARAGLQTYYSDDPRDLGNIADYDQFIEELGGIFDRLRGLLRPGHYLTVIVQNLRDVDGQMRPLAWDLARRLAQSYSFEGERIWCQNSKPLGIWGYPKIFVPNVHHHYCLIFRRRQE